MAHYLPLFQPGHAITRNASAAIVGGQLVAVSGQGLVAPTATPVPHVVGVAAFDAEIGQEILVHRGGVQRLVTSAAVTAGQNLEAASSGRVAPHVNGTNDFNVIGLALTTAGAGALVEVKLAR